ncbi:hypothetical protein CAS74_000333 [Pichia kudriavzevii]|uniref:60S ribosomal protein L22-A n=1 Tax=Pichia kudriavzevii TaxID=4909 RepID=A0A099P927_PICKU|nr:hypothetical protein JL09_g388 [Pichia kudriavzevii]OUT23957.1 hypothetical protein CAS74_000333 [Pichia kudriavzevii]
MFKSEQYYTDLIALTDDVIATTTGNNLDSQINNTLASDYLIPSNTATSILTDSETSFFTISAAHNSNLYPSNKFTGGATAASSQSSSVSPVSSISSTSYAGAPGSNPKKNMLVWGTKKTEKATRTFVVDCATPTENGVFDPESYVKYLVEHIKVDGHLGNLGDLISVSAEGSKVVVVSSTKFSGKYLKYLTKRYLKKNQIRDWIRFISVKKNEYKLNFYSTSVDEEEDEE